jgi:hypothetical protein
MTCCRFSSVKTLLTSTERRPRRSQCPASVSLAGFQTSLIGRFWVTPEAEKRAALFSNPEGMPYASIVDAGGGVDTFPVKSMSYKAWLHGLLRNGARAASLTEAQEQTIFIARETRRDVQSRVAWVEGCIWVDLADAKRQVVRVNADGWEVLISGSPEALRFERGSCAEALPVPLEGGRRRWGSYCSPS